STNLTRHNPQQAVRDSFRFAPFSSGYSADLAAGAGAAVAALVSTAASACQRRGRVHHGRARSGGRAWLAVLPTLSLAARSAVPTFSGWVALACWQRRFGKRWAGSLPCRTAQPRAQRCERLSDLSIVSGASWP